MKKEMLNKPNQLISIIPEQKVTTTQRKAYNSFLKYAQRKLKFEDYKENIFKIPYNELHKRANLKNKNTEYIYQELEGLMKTTVKIVDKENPDNWKAFTLLSYIERKDDFYYYELNHFIINALKEQQFFTPLNLMMIKSLDSQYSIIFYELAIRYQKYKIPKMSIEEVRKLTNTESEYKRFYNFRKRVLDMACEEISEKTDIKLSYSTEKRGRRIAFIDFKIEKKQEEIGIEIKVKEQSYSPQVLELFQLLPSLEQIEANKRELAQLLKEHSLKYLKADIEYAKKTQADNFMGFLKESCAGGHYSSVKLEKQERKEELARQQEQKEQKKKELEKKIKQKAHQKAKEKYEQLSEKEIASYAKDYESLPKMLKEKVSKEEFVLRAIEEEIEKDLKELSELIM
ncbi:replication initiator protein [Orenia metallireducens]|jgi:plasmid replication initiation protein|uniref:Initiator Replication protein n=1 Tax=Orenia metallireducens TaxID=1413210 RepID=A0A285I496_9FIRM|nr:replication initiation protein [Orenia metallireducens]PRX23152.1 replication initiator protein [Orenia metallireducens]SNY42677.1 Initiator Replication protein [Orenia metallireducens]